MEIVVNLPSFQVGDNGQEDPMELEKEELEEETNSENRWQSTSYQLRIEGCRLGL